MSRTTVANGALRHLRNSHTLTDVDTDTSIQAVAIQAVFDDAISEMAREYEWPPLKKIAALALDHAGNADIGEEYAEYYAWPSDCELARYIVDGNRQASITTPQIEFEVVGDGSSKLIATDETSAYLCYTMTVSNVDNMSKKWKRALEYKVAALVAPTLTGGDPTGLGAKAQANYEHAVDDAWVDYLNEKSRPPPPDAEMIAGR